MKRKLALPLAIAAITLWGLSGGPAAAGQNDNAPAGNAQNGKASFASRNCATCHGGDAQGTAGGGPRIGPPPRSWADFVQYVRMPTGNMPPVSAQRVPDAELADIYAYLKTLGSSGSASGPGAATAAFSAGPGDRDHGKKIFTSYGCYECHGYEGQGSRQTAAPRIGPPGLSVAGFASYIRQPTGDMPPYTSKVVSDSDVADIYAYLQSIPQPPPVKSIPLLNQ